MNASNQTKRLAAIDLGSNSIRLMVAEAAPDGSYRILDDEKRTTRLAQGLTRTGVLSQEAMQQSLEALSRMKAIAEGFGVERLQVIATSAVREAKNQGEFLDLVRERLQLAVEVISPEEEGRLSFLSAARHFDLKNKDAAIVDIGGGSAEVILAAKGVVEAIFSLPLGAVRLTEAFVASDPLAPADFKRLKKHIRRVYRSAAGKLGFRPHVMIGAGGTFTALASMAIRCSGEHLGNIGGYELTRSEVRHIRDQLIDLPLRQRRTIPGLNADRADIIVAGVILVERLMKFLKVNRLHIHDRGVRDGLMLRMIGQAFARKAAEVEEDDPLCGVHQFAVACGITQRHSRHVSMLAAQIFDQLQPVLGLDPDERILLEAAALLHEVGCLINYEQHHLHAYHLILHGNMRGLTSKQRELVANIARYHRRSPPKLKHPNYVRLTAAERETVRRLSAILRLADGLDRDHAQRVESVGCRVRAGRLFLTVRAAVRPVVDLWGAEEKGKWFKKVFGLKLRLSWRPVPAGNGRATPHRAAHNKQPRLTTV